MHQFHYISIHFQNCTHNEHHDDAFLFLIVCMLEWVGRVATSVEIAPNLYAHVCSRSFAYETQRTNCKNKTVMHISYRTQKAKPHVNSYKYENQEKSQRFYFPHFFWLFVNLLPAISISFSTLWLPFTILI